MMRSEMAKKEEATNMMQNPSRSSATKQETNNQVHPAVDIGSNKDPHLHQRHQQRQLLVQEHEQHQDQQVSCASELHKNEKTKTKEEASPLPQHEKMEEAGKAVMGPRERLKRHRREVAGHVWIPEMWGQEDFLKDWIDCTAFDASLVPQNIMLARSSLMEEARRATSGSIRVENSC